MIPWIKALEFNFFQQNKTHEFEVASYVVPPFDVSIDLPPDLCVYDDKVQPIIRAQYPHGKPVKGHAIVSIMLRSLSHDGYEFTVNKTMPINGNGSAEFAMANELRIDPHKKYRYPVNFVIEVEVVEELTGRRHNVSSWFQVYMSRYLYKFGDNYKRKYHSSFR